MPSVIQLPSAPNTGYDALANVLLQSATQFGAQRRADTAEERRRSERLADIESDRAYADTNYSRSRTDRLSDIESERKFATDRDLIQRTRQLNDIEEAQLREYEKAARYLEDAKKRLLQLTARNDSLRKTEADLLGKFDESEPEPNPTDVANAARAIAVQNHPDADVRSGKKAPSNADIEQAKPQATEALRQAINVAWQKQRALVQLQQRNIALERADIRAERNTLLNMYRGAIGISAEESMDEAAPATRRLPTVAEVQDEFKKALLPPPAPAPSTPAPAPATDRYGGLVGAFPGIRDVMSGFSDKTAHTAGNLLRLPYRIPAELLGGEKLSSEVDTGVNSRFSRIGNLLRDVAEQRIRNYRNVPVIQLDDAPPRLGEPAPQNPGGSTPRHGLGSRLQILD